MGFEGTTFCLDQRAIVDESGVKSAAVTKEKDGPWVRLTFTDEASNRLLQANRANIGNRIAVVLNGRITAVPVVKAPVSNKIPITGPFTERQANDLAAEFNRQAAHH
jgi:preprotein translocase subunit SecD